MAIQLIIQQAGPLPIQATFQAPSDATVYLEVNGSVWCQNADQPIGIGVNIDGQEVGHALIFSNGSATHRTVVPTYIPLTLTEGDHTLTLFIDNEETVSDSNDFYTAVIHY